MGVFYSYVNWDLEEYFSIGVGGYADKLYGLGHTPGARALGLLMMGPPTGPWSPSVEGGQPVVGRWFQHRLSMEPDEPDTDGRWSTITGTFADVQADVLVMLCIFDDLRTVTELCADDHFFVQVAHLRTTGQLPSPINDRLERALGHRYHARYAELAKQQTDLLAALPAPRWYSDADDHPLPLR